jgi:hypothetical protein
MNSEIADLNECPFSGDQAIPWRGQGMAQRGRIYQFDCSPANGGYRRMGAVDPPFRRQTGVAPIEPAGNGRSTIYT